MVSDSMDLSVAERDRLEEGELEEGEWDGAEDEQAIDAQATVTAKISQEHGNGIPQEEYSGDEALEEYAEPEIKSASPPNRNSPVQTYWSKKDFQPDQWDDSTLIEAWDAAVREYQLYHSDKPATGALKKRKRQDGAATRNEAYKASAESTAAIHADDSQVKSTSEETADISAASRLMESPETQVSSSMHVNHEEQNSMPPRGKQQCQSCGVHSTIPPLAEDEDLANVMMSWYYAGYYSGVYAAKV
ncbi:hypothetical protein BC832DRAFT_79980 [Gaertneriomyces semiglobifer]|nr:hypothetical protein BC832DRAFT_79980 [Gaertneriomyces semiglobifer]